MLASRESPRFRRLRNDFKALQKLRSESSVFDFHARETHSDPPHEYLIRFHGRGVWRSHQGSDIQWREGHEISIRLGANYPRTMPDLVWRTPIFHPNISSSGVICLGGYGTFWAPSLHLDELCVMLWDMARYANYDVNSPYNREAALWAKTVPHGSFPIDPRPLRDRPLADAPAARASSPGSSTLPAAPASRPVAPPAPEIEFLGEVVEAEVIDAEGIESTPHGGHGPGPRPPQTAFPRPPADDILIIE